MVSLFRSSLAHHGIALAAVTVCGAWLLALLAISDVDLVPLRTLRIVTESGDAVVETRYNPLGVLGLGVLAAAVCASAVLAAQFLSSFLRRGQHDSAHRIASASKTLGRELGNALSIIRRNLANNEAYARSLASSQARLGELTEVEQVRMIISLLVAENERMRLASAEDKSKIEACARDIEALQVSLRGAEEATLKDPLTGIGNRRLFDDAMRKAINDSTARRTPLSLIMCDIDHFKRVNDKFGHHVGDEIIRAFAGVMEANVREKDIVARYGGEEFAIILPGTDQRVALESAERIRRQFGAKQFAVRETKQKIGRVTASFGVAEYQAGDDTEAFVKRADAKLYEAKVSGRDRVAHSDKRP